MRFDEKLAKIEQEKRWKAVEEERIQNMIRDAEEKSRLVKSVDEIVATLQEGWVDIEGNIYESTDTKVLSQKVNLTTFPKYMNIIQDTDQIFAAEYDELTFSININYSTSPFVISKISEYKKVMTSSLKQMKLNITWVDQGIIEAKDKKVNYCTGILPSRMGNIYQLMFYYNLDTGGISGNFNCQLNKKDNYNNLFKAILTKI